LAPNTLTSGRAYITLFEAASPSLCDEIMR
jgi:hypothetical protein